MGTVWSYFFLEESQTTSKHTVALVSHLNELLTFYWGCVLEWECSFTSFHHPYMPTCDITETIFIVQNVKNILYIYIYIYILFLYIHIFTFYILSKATYIAFKLQFYILSALAFPGNRTHDLGVASAMLYHLSYRKAFYWNESRLIPPNIKVFKNYFILQ